MSRRGAPCGEIRKAMLDAASKLAQQHGAATWRDMAQVAQVGFAAAKVVHRDLVRAGQLQAVDEVRTPYNNRPMKRWAPVPAGDRAANFATSATGFGPINSAMRSWFG